MSPQIWAVAAVVIVVIAAAGLERNRARRASRIALLATADAAREPYILYFTGEGCTVCKTHQEPALAKLSGVRVDRVDALVDRELAERFQVYTLPTTIVMAPDGKPMHVNYGYAPATKLHQQLAAAGFPFGSTVTAEA
jgi:hypothetical protein